MWWDFLLDVIIVGLFLGCHGDGGNRLTSLSTVKEYMDICMDGISHKPKPGPEVDLYGQCLPWKDRSCCTNDLSKDININKTWYKLDWSHCPDRTLSARCRGRFIQDLCFYECSPNVGPWLVKVEGMKIRKERFVNVPLCERECNAWWEDCKDDYTCVINWSRNFDWSSGEAKCPEGTQCRRIEEMYGNALNFCEKVWDDSWKVAKDNDPDGCFVMRWNGDENPNYNIAMNKAKTMVSSSSRVMPLSSVFLTLFTAIIQVLVKV